MIYLIGHDPFGPIKIGQSVDASARLLTFQAGCPISLNIYALGNVTEPGIDPKIYPRIEHIMHQRLNKYRLHREWFDLSVLDIMSHTFANLDIEELNSEYYFALFNSSYIEVSDHITNMDWRMRI